MDFELSIKILDKIDNSIFTFEYVEIDFIVNTLHITDIHNHELIYQSIKDKLSDYTTSISQKVIINKHLVQNMIDREIELRESDEWQTKMSLVEDDPMLDWLDVVSKLQIKVVKEFGFTDIKYGLNILRSATNTYDLERIPNYVKFNRATKGILSIDDFAPNPLIHKYSDLSEVKLFDKDDERLLFIFAGAIT
jgi:hypothetical protein